MKYLFLVISAAIAFGLFLLVLTPPARASAQTDDLDQWCSEATKASSIVICSDSELRRLTMVRGKLLETLKSYLLPDDQKQLDKNQAGWVVAYTQGCGVSRDGPIPTTISPQVVACYRAASNERNRTLMNAISKHAGTATASVPSTPAPRPAAPPSAAPLTSLSDKGLSFTTVFIDDDKMWIHMSGTIENGDFLRYAKFIERLAKNPSTKNRLITGISLNSIGGLVDESITFAKAIKGSNFAAVVAPDSRCASACVLLFAAAKVRIAARGVYIGVHSASNVDSNYETVHSTAATVTMARVLGNLGMPSSIIGRMVTTNPNNMYRLTEADLRTWGVNIVEP